MYVKNNFNLIAGKRFLKPNDIKIYTKIRLIKEFVDNLFRLLSKLFIRRKVSVSKIDQKLQLMKYVHVPCALVVLETWSRYA